jgi:hypothetical protein
MALWNPDQKYKLLMQTVPPKAEDFERKVVVTISKPRSETESSNDAQTGGLPDAWILGDLNLGILIESKLQSKPDEQQIQGHLEKVKWNNYQYARVDLTWPEVYQCMKACLNEQMNEKDKFLIDQFNRYLELVGMSPFSGFENADFDLFTNYEELKDYSPFVKTKMNDFAKQVHLKLPNKIREKYPIPKSGNIYDLEEREIWIAFQIKKDSKNPFQHCNLNSVIDATGIRCAAVIRDGKYVDKKKPIGILYDKLNDPNSLKKFEKILSNLGKGFSLVINRRTDKYGTKKQDIH